jgi:hypothetical protein
MYRIDPQRKDLAREFRAKPFGTHSPELQTVLNIIRRPENCQSLVAIVVKPHEQWLLARSRPGTTKPELVSNTIYNRLEDLEWAAFKMRWEAITGEKLDIDD